MKKLYPPRTSLSLSFIFCYEIMIMTFFTKPPFACTRRQLALPVTGQPFAAVVPLHFSLRELPLSAIANRLEFGVYQDYLMLFCYEICHLFAPSSRKNHNGIVFGNSDGKQQISTKNSFLSLISYLMFVKVLANGWKNV